LITTCLPFIVPEELMQQAQMMADCRNGNRKLNDRSFMGGHRNVAGFVGELVFGYCFPNWTYVGDKEYGWDFELVRANRKTLTNEVKAKTQRASTDPILGGFEASIPVYTYNLYNPTFYTFIRLHETAPKSHIYDYGWLVGWIRKEHYKPKSYHLKEGTFCDNGMLARTDSYQMSYSALNPSPIPKWEHIVHNYPR